MIRIVYIKNQFQLNEREVFEFTWAEDKSVREYLSDTHIDIPDTAVMTSALKGKVSLGDTLLPDDELLIINKVEGAIAIGAIVGFLIKSIVVYAVGMALNFAINSIFGKSSKPTYGTQGQGLDDGSPTYSWDGIRTIQDVGVPIPIVYGRMKLGGNVINAYISSDGDKNYFNMLLALCEGEIKDIDFIKINDNPIENFTGITAYERFGTNDDTIIPNFDDLHTTYNQSVTLTQSNPYIYTTTGTDLEGFKLHLKFPNGLFEQDNTSGEIRSWSVTYTVEYKLHSEGTWSAPVSVTVDYKARNQIYRVYEVLGLTPGKYDIRITRTSADSDFYHIGDLVLYAVDEIVTDDLKYPNTAKLGIKALATDQLSGATPDVSCIVTGRLIYCPHIKLTADGSTVNWEDYYYDGEYKRLSDGAPCYQDGYHIEWCANPIWCMRDLLSNTRFGLGDFVEAGDLSDSVLLEMSRYAEHKVPDGAGGFEKRFRLDVAIDSTTSALDLITQLCATYRGLPFYTDGKIKITIDKPEIPTQLFGMGNIIQDSFTQTWKPVDEIYNVIDVVFLDKDKDYERETVSVIDEESLAAGDPLRRKEIRIFTTKMSYALREGRYALKLNKYINRTATWKAGIDAIGAQVGDVVGVSHDVPQWGYSGRVLSGSNIGENATIKFDRLITMTEGNEYEVTVRDNDDDTLETRGVLISGSLPLTTDTVKISGTFSFTPDMFDVFAFGILTQSKRDFRIINMEYDDTNEVMITAVEYNENVYDDSAVTIPTNNWTGLSMEVPPVTDLVVQQGGQGLTIDVYFNVPTGDDYFVNRYDRARIYFSDNGGDSWLCLGETTGTYWNITDGLEPSIEYTIKVVSVSQSGETSPFNSAPSDTVTLTGGGTGGYPTPADVANFANTFGDWLVLTWNAVTTNGVVGYEIRDENTGWGTVNAHLIYQGNATIFSYKPPARTVGTLYIKAFNIDGEYSENSASTTPSNAVPTQPTNLSAEVLFNIAHLSWETTDSDIIDYEVYRSETNEWAGEEELVDTVVGKMVQLLSNDPRGGTVESATSTTLVDDDLIGLPDDYFNGDVVEITNGTGNGQMRTISDFDGTTGTLTLSSAWDTNPDSDSFYMIFDRCYIKVRARDAYGFGPLSGAYTLTFEAIDENALGDNIITARKIYVGCLSAISANMGEITAGTITGGVFQTAAGGARTIFDMSSIRSYDTSCLENFVVCNGCVCARNLKLLHPTNDSCYSYLDAGALKFHDSLGDVPYVKRIKSGTACSGDTIELCGWCSPPDVMVGINTLTSYNNSCTSSQEWRVYADAPVWFCTAANCYGYRFNVHAALVVQGGVADTCVHNVNFNVCVNTHAATCCTTVQHRFTLWCYPGGASCYCYGCQCYRVCYRLSTCGTGWEGSRDFTYEQPHASTAQLCSLGCTSNVICFPCQGTWTLMASSTGLSWHNSGIQGGSVTTGTCTRNFGTAYCCMFLTVAANSCCSCYYCTPLSLQGSNPACIYCNLVCFSWYTAGTAGQCCQNYSHHANYYYGCLKCATMSAWLCADSTIITSCIKSHQTVIGSCNYCCSWTASSVASLGHTNNVSQIYFKQCLHHIQCGSYNSFSSNQVCVAGGCLIQCYCSFSGAAAGCMYQRLYSTTDILGAQTILDPNGCLNWLAISYS